jgi:hypothetical protein
MPTSAVYIKSLSLGFQIKSFTQDITAKQHKLRHHESGILISTSQSKYTEETMSKQVPRLAIERKQNAAGKGSSSSRIRPKKWKIEAMKPLYLVRYE